MHAVSVRAFRVRACIRQSVRESVSVHASRQYTRMDSVCTRMHRYASTKCTRVFADADDGAVEGHGFLFLFAFARGFALQNRENLAHRALHTHIMCMPLSTACMHSPLRACTLHCVHATLHTHTPVSEASISSTMTSLGRLSPKTLCIWPAFSIILKSRSPVLASLHTHTPS